VAAPLAATHARLVEDGGVEITRGERMVELIVDRRPNLTTPSS
jgi:hypothetical protein